MMMAAAATKTEMKNVNLVGGVNPNGMYASPP